MACLALYFSSRDRRQPQQLPRRVHDRVVRRVLGGLDPAHDREADAGGDDRVAAERDERQRQQHAAQPGVLDQARRDERLEQERRDVDPELIVAGEGADVRLLVERRVGRRQLAATWPVEQPRDQVLAGRVDDVEQDDEQRDQPQIRAAQAPARTRRRPAAALAAPRLRARSRGALISRYSTQRRPSSSTAEICRITCGVKPEAGTGGRRRTSRAARRRSCRS